MRLKVVEGTRHEGASLCLTCRNAVIIQGTALGEEIMECNRLSSANSRIPFPVVKCSAYSDRRVPGIGEMEEIAWILRTDPRRKHIGFVRAHDLKPHERYLLRDPDAWR